MPISRIDSRDTRIPFDRYQAMVIGEDGRPMGTVLVHGSLPHTDADTPSHLVFTHLPARLKDPIWNGERWIEGRAHISLSNWLRILGIALLLILICAKAHGQNNNVNVARAGGTTVPAGVVDSGNSAFKVNCVVGCSAAGSFTDNSAFNVGATSVTNLGAYYTSGADPSISTGNSGRLRMDSHSYLAVDCLVGCAGGSTTPSDAFANPTTAGLQFDFLAVWNGATWDRWKGDATNGAFVNVKTSVLPTGAATAAKQPALGTAGTASADVITIQGIASMTKLLVTPDSVALPANQSVNVAQIAGQTTTTTDNGTQGVAPQATASSTGALADCNILSAASTNSTNCKGSAGNLYGYEIYNTTTTIYYLRLYNTASAPTCSSATGFIRSIPIKPADAAGGLGGAITPLGPIPYATGISYCITAGSSSTDNTNAAAGIFGVLKYK